jgi:hypothetical protein
MSDYYNRYSKFMLDGQVFERVPFAKIPVSGGDKYVTFEKSKMRMDMLSYKYYGDPNYGWMILQANPQYGGFEFSIPEGVELRIPYPLEDAISRYESSANAWINEHRSQLS